MKPLTQTAAMYFVAAFGANAAVKGQSVNDYLGTLPSGSITFVEGTARFDLLKDCLLRESEQALLLSSNCYARALEGLREGSAYWSMVGFYYAAFLSINVGARLKLPSSAR